MSLRVPNKSCVMYILLMSVQNKVVGALNTKMMNRATELRLQKLSQLKEDITLKILLSAENVSYVTLPFKDGMSSK